MFHKRTWLFALLIITALLLAACPAAQPAAQTGGESAAEAPAQEAAAPAQEGAGEATAEVDWENVDPSGQTVTFWYQHTQEREEALQQIIADFNETNEWGITVVGEYQGGYGDIFNKMLNVLNTSEAPNLVVAYQNQAATYQLANGLIDMNPLVNSPKWGLSEEEQADFFPGFFNSDIFPSFGNQRLGFPPNRSMEVMYYNLDWLQELGFDGPPQTPEEFKEAACRAVEQPFSKGVGDAPSMGYQLSVDASRFASWTFAFGGDIFDYENNRFTYDSEAAQAAMTFLQGLFNEGCATLVAEQYGDQTDFGNGRLLFTVGSSSGLPFYRSVVDEGAQFNWSVGPLPHTTPDPVMNIYGASVSIPRTTHEQELAAWLFVKYYTSPEVQATWAKASNYFPVRQSVAESMADYFEAEPAYKAAFDLLPYGVSEPPVPGYDFVRDMIEQKMAAIMDGADVAATLAEANEEANAILAEQMEGLQQ
ncbi:ABC transporter substrate-binding protein [Litorilinea aerophila]|uniref:ABC transporter substrate-binding protein n=1 Tax=Litorilinea aerophila TaxID=1204385 RepID=A0A540VD60_9CHLR|nr:ABC transporter substrate-binding protein [Litorilinea aerophila]MCC9077537.1 ABC transporter substrate-binding protein [Litorilinea aerophila]GIV79376.1 MAG: ABC transporter substrate-binding protein [Litorilinea sp.]